MLAKKTSKNRVTLPKAIVQQLPEVNHFEVSLSRGEIALKPAAAVVPGERLRVVRARMAALGLTERDGERTIRWGRSRRD